MAITPTASDPFGLGTDIALLGDLNGVWGLVSGFTNLGYALARRLNAELGSLFTDLGYGEDCSDLINAGMTPAYVAKKAGAISAQCRLDERVQTCQTTFSLNAATGALTVNVTGTIPTGAPFSFQFIVDPTTVTVALLSINGVAIVQPTTATGTAQSTGGNTTIIVQGGSSEPGPPGPPGPSGSASEAVPIADVESSLGTEDPQAQTQKEVNWGALPASITITLNGMFSSASGSAIFRVRINGSDNVADGTVVATITASSSSATSASGGSTITNPGGLGRLIVTADSSGASVDCAGRNMTLTIR